MQRVVSATLITFALVAGLSYLLRADISRAYAFISLPAGLILIVAGRFYWRGWLYRARSKGRFMSPTVVVGSGHGADDLAQWLNDGPYAGYAVVATVAAPVANQTSLSGWLDSLDNVITETGATAITLAPAEQSPSGLVKELAWRLEGRRIDLLIAPGMLDIAGPRLHIRPAAGLPLLHLEEAVLSRHQPQHGLVAKTQNVVLILWGFVLAYELSAVAFSYVEVVPWYAGDRWSMGLEALALVSCLGLSGLIAYGIGWVLRVKDPDSTAPLVNTAKLVAMALVLVVSIPLTITVFNRLNEYRHFDFRTAGSKLSAIAAQAFPPGAQVDWLVDYWSWPTFRYEVLKSGTFPTTFQITSATPFRLPAYQDGADVLTSKPRCGPNLWTAVLQENWGSEFASRNALFAAKVSAMSFVSKVYQISNDESLIVFSAPGGTK